MVLYTTNNIHCNYLTDEAVTILKDKPVEHWANVDITKGQSMESSDKLFWKVIGTHLHKMASHENVEGFVYILCQMRKTFKHFTIASSLTHFFVSLVCLKCYRILLFIDFVLVFCCTYKIWHDRISIHLFFYFCSDW